MEGKWEGSRETLFLLNSVHMETEWEARPSPLERVELCQSLRGETLWNSHVRILKVSGE